MRSIFLIGLLLVSCGKNKTFVQKIENDYDDSKLRAYELIQDARINELEIKTQLLESLSNSNASDVENLRASIEDSISTINTTLDSIQSDIRNFDTVQVLPFCNSSENFIKAGNNIYAVYMVSNNFGTYLGKLEENVQYQTTDSIRARFTVSNGEIVCE